MKRVGKDIAMMGVKRRGASICPHCGKDCPFNPKRKKPIVHDVPSKDGKKLIGVLTPDGMVPASEGVARKFLRMTLAERTRFVELFAGFSDADWRRFKRWIRKLKGEKK